MSIPKCKDFEDYNNYPNDANPTSNAQMQEFMKNQNDLVKEAASFLWQPQTTYVAGQFVFSDNIPKGAFAVCTTAGTTGITEPSWSSVNGNTNDGGVVWNIRKLNSDFNDLKNKPSALKNPQSLTVKVNGETKAVYDGSVAKSVEMNVVTKIGDKLPDANGNVDISYITESLSNLDDDISYVTNKVSQMGDVQDTIVERYQNGAIWYRLYKSGFVIEGSIILNGSNSRSWGGRVNWPLKFKNANYNYFAMPEREGSGNMCMCIGSAEKNESGVYVSVYGNGSSDQAKYIQVVAFGEAAGPDDVIPNSYTLKVTRYNSSQTVTTTVNGTQYKNDIQITVTEGSTVTVNMTSYMDNKGELIVNGTNIHSTSYSGVVSNNITITMTRPYDDTHEGA